MDGLVKFFTGALAGSISREGICFIISLLPILELRGGLLAASLLQLDYPRALAICVLGNLLPIPFVLLGINQALRLMERLPLTAGVAGWVRRKAEKNKPQIQRYGFWGLTLFVGIPLPGTGAWTGALVAALLHMPLRRSVPAILLGIVMAAAIMSLLSYGLLARLL